MKGKEERIDIDNPLWKQNTYYGRWLHFAQISDTRTIFVPEQKLLDAKELCDDYKRGDEPEDITLEDVICAKKLKDNAFHPDNNELIPVIGRMSFQLPASVLLTTAILKSYKSSIGSVASQLMNQAYTAIVNYSNRSAVDEEPQTMEMIQKTFVCATVASTATVLAVRKMLFAKGVFFQKLAPFCSMFAGNIVNLPIMRKSEITSGVPIFEKEGDETCIMKSRTAAIKGISECAISRVIMSTPAMIIVPSIMQRIYRECFYQLRPWIGFPITIVICTACSLIMIPSSLAIFPRKNTMRPELIELFDTAEYDEFKNRIKSTHLPCKVYYSKGL